MLSRHIFQGNRNFESQTVAYLSRVFCRFLPNVKPWRLSGHQRFMKTVFQSPKLGFCEEIFQRFLFNFRRHKNLRSLLVNHDFPKKVFKQFGFPTMATFSTIFSLKLWRLSSKSSGFSLLKKVEILTLWQEKTFEKFYFCLRSPTNYTGLHET